MNTHAYDRAHDAAQRLNRRHERDLHWAKERRRHQERDIAEAVTLLETSRFALVRKAVVVDVVLLVAIGAGLWAAAAAALTEPWSLVVGIAAGVAAAGVLTGAAISLVRVGARRAAARTLLDSREARLAHTQFHIHESVHSYIDSYSDVISTRLASA
ncbi:hypothetical protein ACFVU2_18185 [Leifsonia sp. NPDC058194]|uniref:hypothetical protein n=1 Tax=Leifsonia sp. NPDC058194 TaxID=3346374 RepID=UPI0036DF58F9